MSKKPLIETNQHLHIPEKYRQALVANVSSSTAIETGASIESVAQSLGKPAEHARPKKPQESSR